MYRVFLSYNSSDEMAVAWRLQTLAAASGLSVDVPTKKQRTNWVTISKMIREADWVIVFLTGAMTPQLRNELSLALELKKPVIPIVEGGTTTVPIQELLKHSGVPVFELDRNSPWLMENTLAKHLEKRKYDKDTKNVILALAGTFIGLLLLDKLAES